MKVELCTPSELGRAEIAAWRRLQAEVPELANPFLSPTFARVVGELDPLARVAVLYEGNELAGFLPFHRTRSGIARGLAHGIAGCQGLVSRPGLELDPARLLRGCRAAVWELDHLVAPAPAPLAGAAGVSMASTSLIDLGGGFDAYVSNGMKRCKKYFNWLRRKRQRIESDLGPVRFEFGTAGAGALARVVEWKSAQYRRSGWPDPFAKAWVRELVERLRQTEEADLIGSCSSLSAGDELLAVDFSLRSPSVYAGWFVTYNRDFEHFSPGAVRWWYVAEACAWAGVSWIDLGCGDEEYKQKLATRHGEVLEGNLRRATPRAFVRCAARTPRRAARRFVLEHPRLRAGVRAVAASPRRAA